jgi:hypothetical protein
MRPEAVQPVEEETAVSDQTPDVPADRPTSASPREGDPVKVTAVANTAFVGIPAAYAATGSIPVTVIAAVVASGFVFFTRQKR